MRNNLCSKHLRIFKANSGWAALAWCVLLVFPLPGHAAVPDWLRAAARAQVPTYSDETNAVVLLDEGVAVVKDNGDIETTSRLAARILRSEGKRYGVKSVYFDNDTRLTYLKGWSIGANGTEYEVKEKDAVESVPFDVSLYSDTRRKTLTLPGVEVGAVVGFEYVQRQRPTTFQAVWGLHHSVPVLRSRYTIRLAPGWEYSAIWVNFPEQKPVSESGNETVWEIQNIPAIEHEPSMPAASALAGKLALTFFSQKSAEANKSHVSWGDVGKWYTRLVADRRTASPEIQQKTRELTAGLTGSLEKMRALASFVQTQIRYVAIEIGIGGLQPHPASQIYSNLYGDCKDKATLLSSMLQEIGIESYYVVIDTERGTVAPQFPTIQTFNHVILAIRLPQDVDGNSLYSVVQNAKLGNLLIFDPTDSDTPFGYLRAELQDTDCLLVANGSGELVHLPLLPPSLNRLLRSATITLDSNGSMSGSVQELRWGDHGSRWRHTLANAPENDRSKLLENYLGEFMGGVVFQGVQVEGLEQPSKPLVLRYRFEARNYAKVAGNLLLLRPRVLGQKSSPILEGKERKNPVEFDGASLETDMVDITLPPGYVVDELPPPLAADCGFTEYKSSFKMEGNVLKYMRSYTVKQISVPKDKLPELKAFYRQVAGDERNNAVLKRTSP